jgi:hypothetical protein
MRCIPEGDIAFMSVPDAFSIRRGPLAMSGNIS